jgi:aromatic ring-opening dioxygenase catalytic subunit (LigB family)
MAQIVAGIGVPHNPNYPDLVRREGAQSEVARLYQAVADEVTKSQLDVLVCFSSDHMNTFFLDNLPLLSVGITDQVAGPNDQTRMPSYVVPIHAELGAHIRTTGIGQSFDLGVAQEFDLDHSFMVPLHFLVPHMRIPIVPIFLAGIVEPLPRADRCYALGEAVRSAVESWPSALRVGVLGSGSFSLDIGGIRGAPGQMTSYPDPAWVRSIMEALEHASLNDLVSQTTPDQLARAGNVGGEILNWIAMLGAVGEHRPSLLEQQSDAGHAYAAWHIG